MKRVILIVFPNLNFYKMADNKSLEERVDYLEKLLESTINIYAKEIIVLQERCKSASPGTPPRTVSDRVYEDVDRKMQE